MKVFLWCDLVLNDPSPPQKKRKKKQTNNNKTIITNRPKRKKKIVKIVLCQKGEESHYMWHKIFFPFCAF